MYHELFKELSLFSKLIVYLRSWFQGESVEVGVRHREYRLLYRRLERDHHEIVDPAIPVLLGGFTRRLFEIAKRMTVVKTVVEEVTGNRAGRFLQTSLKSLDPEISEQLDAATRVPEELLEDYTVTLEQANKSLKERMHQALEVNQSQIFRVLGPVWTSLIGLKFLAGVQMKNMLPAEGGREPRIPLRAVRDDLIRLYQELEFCRKHQEPRGLDLAAEFTTQRLGRSFAVYRALWEMIEDMLVAVPLLDIIRLALEEPRATVKQVKHPQDWWPLFENAWMDTLEAGSSILRHRAFRLESILHDEFSVAAPPISWIPTTLYPRTVGALRRLASGTEFRLTRVFVGTLAREEGILRLTSKKDLLDGHVQLDQQLDKLEELIGSGDNRGKIGEEVKRLNAGNSDAALVRIQMAGVLSKFRPLVREIINDAIDALESILRVCAAEERGITKSFPRLNAALADTLGETTSRYVLDLIVHRYGPLVDALRGLAAIEREMSAGADVEPEEILETIE